MVKNSDVFPLQSARDFSLDTPFASIVYFFAVASNWGRFVHSWFFS